MFILLGSVVFALADPFSCLILGFAAPDRREQRLRAERSAQEAKARPPSGDRP